MISFSLSVLSNICPISGKVYSCLFRLIHLLKTKSTDFEKICDRIQYLLDKNTEIIKSHKKTHTINEVHLNFIGDIIYIRIIFINFINNFYKIKPVFDSKFGKCIFLNKLKCFFLFFPIFFF